jgi:Phosphotransferase enzyme family
VNAIVTRGDGRVLLEGGVLLSLTGTPEFVEAAKVLSNMLSGEVVPLHQDSRYSFPENPELQIWLFESLEPERVPKGFAWHGIEALEIVCRVEHRTVLEMHFGELETIPAHRQPWQRPGWLEMARAWLKEQYPNAMPLEVQHTWHGAWNGVSSVVGRKLYFKAVPEQLGLETKLLPWLGRYSSIVPEAVAVNEARGWLATWSAGETALIREAQVKHWCEALSGLAKLQIATLPHHVELEALGCHALTSTDALLEAHVFLETSTLEHTPMALERLSMLAGKLETLDALPLALCHGDFHPMNVIAPKVLIDWTDAMIAHPFTDLERFLRWIMGSRQSHPWSPFVNTHALQPLFLDAYLEPWSSFAPLATLRRTFLETRPFGFVALIAQHARLEQKLGLDTSSLRRSLLPHFVRQLATFRTYPDKGNRLQQITAHAN